uniref:SFR19-like C-terminal domain-containing protein n=1 Tax=Salarias fasciatus TaxID=181472 RepID=A0A672GQJ4_SALFA
PLLFPRHQAPPPPGQEDQGEGGPRRWPQETANRRARPTAGPRLPWTSMTALLFKMEEANIASRAKAQEFIQATSQVTSCPRRPPPPPRPPPLRSLPLRPCRPPPGLSPAQFLLHGSLPPAHLHASMGGVCAQTPPPMLPPGLSGLGGARATPYLKKLHTQERAVEEVKLAIKPYYQRKDINKDEYKDILRKAVHKICHSRTGEINPVKVSNLVKLYVQRYKYFRKHGRKMDEEEREDREPGPLHSSS